MSLPSLDKLAEENEQIEQIVKHLRELLAKHDPDGRLIATFANGNREPREIRVAVVASSPAIAISIVLHSLVGLSEGLLSYSESLIDAVFKLEKHRKPHRHAVRDAEIMRLHGEGKTAGKIAKLLKVKGKSPDRTVTAVISRERRKATPTTR